MGGMFWFATTHRIGSCCGLCGVNALFIIVTLVLGGLGLQPMSTDKLGEVGLTLIEDRYQRRANAYAKGALEASFDLVTARCPRSIAADPIILILMKGSFDDEGGNALTTEGLSELRKREERITSHAGWGERCKLSYATAYPTCTPAPLSSRAPSRRSARRVQCLAHRSYSSSSSPCSFS